MTEQLTGIWLGTRRYGPTIALQRHLFELRKRGQLGDVVLLLEHEPVITLGRGAKEVDLLETRAALSKRGVDVEPTCRGGEITVHVPGQLIAYPIVHLEPGRQDVRRYVNSLMAVMTGLLQTVGIEAGKVPGWIGVWVDRDNPGHYGGLEQSGQLEKIGAVGVRLSRWVTMHGFALNLCPAMDLFRAVVPCGIASHGVCSVEQVCGERVSPRQWAAPAWKLVGEQLGRACDHWLDLSEIDSQSLADQIESYASAAPPR